MNILNVPGFTAEAALHNVSQYHNPIGVNFSKLLVNSVNPARVVGPGRCGGPWGPPVNEVAFDNCMQTCFFNGGHHGTTGSGCRVGCCMQLTGCSRCYVP